MLKRIPCFNERLIPYLYSEETEKNTEKYLKYTRNELVEMIREDIAKIGIKIGKIYLISENYVDFLIFSSLKSSPKNTIVVSDVKKHTLPPKVTKLYYIRTQRENMRNPDEILATYLTDIDLNGNLVFSSRDYSSLLSFKGLLILDISRIFWRPTIDKMKLLNKGVLIINVSPWLLLTPRLSVLIVSPHHLRFFNLSRLERFRIENSRKAILASLVSGFSGLLNNNLYELYREISSYSNYLLTELYNNRKLKVYTDIDEGKHFNIAVINELPGIREELCLKIYSRCYIFIHYIHSYKDIDYLIKEIFSRVPP